MPEFEKEEFTFPDEQVEKESASEVEFEIVADVDLVYLGVKLMLSSVETMEQLKSGKSIAGK